MAALGSNATKPRNRGNASLHFFAPARQIITGHINQTAVATIRTVAVTGDLNQAKLVNTAWATHRIASNKYDLFFKMPC